MGRRNFGKKKKSNQQKKQKNRLRKSSKGYPGIPQEQVTCRELAIYVPPEDESDKESNSSNDYYDHPEFYDEDLWHEDPYGRFNYFDIREYLVRTMLSRLFEAMVLSEMMDNRRGGQPFGFNSRRARR